MFESEFLTSSPESKESYRQLISQAAQLVCECFPSHAYSGASVSELAALISGDFLPEHGLSPDQIAGTFRSVISNSVAVSDVGTIAHLHCPPLLASLAAEVVISALNQSMDSFDQAPIATIVEQKLVMWLCAQAGLPATADGTFTAGGSQSNYMGLLLARDAFLKKHWNWPAQKRGLHPEAGRLRILCSEVAHFTVEKSAAQLGLGTDAVVRVAVDDQFRMSVTALRDEIDGLHGQALLPMAIVATAGTTDFGSIDPIADIADIARQTGAWLHVDAAYGGALLFSPRQRGRLAGLESADSVSIDFHKLFWQPIPCSVFLLANAQHFDLIKMHADYLNPEAHETAGIPDLVTKSVLTSRRFDALKLWISFQTLGREKLAQMIDRTISLANHAAGVIRRNPRLELMCEPQLSTVVFRVLPAGPGMDSDQLTANIRQQLFRTGRAVIGHTRVRNHPCLKFTCMNPAAREADIEALIEQIVQLSNTGTYSRQAKRPL
ncbi:MAG: pyridoxal phosphate-dependent decarboxylase family protein [Candidatus Sulfotelmatobacter sp.]